MGGPLQDDPPYRVAFRRAVYQGVPAGVLVTLGTYAVGHNWVAAGIAGGITFCSWALGRGYAEGMLDTRALKN